MELKEIKSFLETQAGAKMKEYLEERLESFRSIEVLDTTGTNEIVGEDAKVQKLAYKMLERILDDIMLVERENKIAEKAEEDSLIPGV